MKSCQRADETTTQLRLVKRSKKITESTLKQLLLSTDFLYLPSSNVRLCYIVMSSDSDEQRIQVHEIMFYSVMTTYVFSAASCHRVTDGTVASQSMIYPNYQTVLQSSVWPHAVNRGRRWRRQVVCLSVCLSVRKSIVNRTHALLCSSSPEERRHSRLSTANMNSAWTSTTTQRVASHLSRPRLYCFRRH